MFVSSLFIAYCSKNQGLTTAFGSWVSGGQTRSHFYAISRKSTNDRFSAAGIYEVPDELKEKVASAVISPSSTETRGAGAGAGAGGRRRALDPAGDSTADTAQLVLEDKHC